MREKWGSYDDDNSSPQKKVISQGKCDKTTKHCLVHYRHSSYSFSFGAFLAGIIPIDTYSLLSSASVSAVSASVSLCS